MQRGDIQGNLSCDKRESVQALIRDLDQGKGEEAEEEERHWQRLKVLKFFIKTCPLVIVMEGLSHHLRDMPGSSLVVMMLPFFNLLNALICRHLLSQRGRYPFVEKNISSIFLLVLMISITDGSIYTSP